MKKFRVWDNQMGEYVAFDYIVFSQNGEFALLVDGQAINSENGDETLVVEQDTGIEDINGEPIYEGDILGDMSEHGAMTIDGEDEGYVRYENGDVMTAGLFQCDYPNGFADLTIVGNMHEGIL